ncbi:hypothetical protein RUND412_009608 [Rhizina undulata]
MFQHPTTTTFIPKRIHRNFSHRCTPASHRRARINTGTPTKTQHGGLPRTSPSSLAKIVTALRATEYGGRVSYMTDSNIEDNGEAQ